MDRSNEHQSMDLPRQIQQKEYEDDKENFLGEQICSSYKIYKAYLQGQGTQLRLYYRRFTPNQNPHASLCIIHGFGEHSGKFSHIADFFCKKGFEIYLIDLRGFGYSGGPRGCSTLSQMLTDIGVLLSQARSNLPLYLYGHSMGGLLVLVFTLLNEAIQISGVIATSPLIGFPQDRKLDYFKLNFVKNVGKKLEDLVVNSMVNPTALTKNNAYLKHVFGDRLMIPFLGLNMASSLLLGTEYLKENAPKFNKPIIILHGKQDSVTNYHDSIYFFEKCSSTEKALKLFDNGYHELQHDEECEELKSVISDWISRTLEHAKPVGQIPQSINSRLQQKETFFGSKKILLLLILFIYIILIIKQAITPF